MMQRDRRDGLAQIRDAFGDGQANSVADDDGGSDPVVSGVDTSGLS
jgi:hypothetical protein